MIFETVFQCEESDNKIIIPLDPDWKTLAIQVSGGADSALITYLTAKTIMEHNLPIKIRTISSNVATKPLYIPGIRKVIAEIKRLSGFTQWEDHYEHNIPLDESNNPMRKYAIRNHLKALFSLKLIDYEFSGVTKNPPLEASKHFINNENRELDREGATTIYTGDKSARPGLLCDKQGIVELYKTHGLIDTLFPLTVSCDADITQVVDGKFPCETKCWWCAERAWALNINGVTHVK